MPREASVGLELLEPVERDDLPQVRQGAADGDELPRLLVVLGEREHRLAVVEDVFALLGGARGIEADDDGADRHHGPVEQDPLEPGAGEDRHAVAVAHAACEQPLRERRDALRGFAPRDRPPAVRRLLEIRGLGRRVADGLAPELGHRAPFHLRNRMQGSR